MRRRLACLALLPLAACASAGLPPGGPPDDIAPAIVRVRPESGAVNVKASSVIIYLDEVVSERPGGATDGTAAGAAASGLGAIVIVSPTDGRERVTWRRTAIEIELARGLLPPVFNVPAPPESAWSMPRALAEARARGAFGGTAPELSFWVPAGSEVGVRLAEYVTAAWRRSGLRVTIVERAWPEFRRGIADGQADVFYWSWFADGPDPIAFLESMTASDRRGDGGNRTHYSNPEVDRALAAARGAATDFAATQALRRAELLALADAPLVPLFHSINVTLVRPGVSGLLLDPLGAPRYDTVEVR